MGNQKNEQEHLDSHARGLFAGLLMGGLIGSGTMVLLAPRARKKARAKIQREGMNPRAAWWLKPWKT